MTINALVLPDTGREYCTLTLADDTPELPMQVSFDGGTNWSDLERIDATHARCLVAGPDATGNPVGAIVLARGLHPIIVALTTPAERIIRTAPKALAVENLP